MFCALSWSHACLYMHGLLCLPSLLCVLIIMLGLPLYMPGIPCLPSLLVSVSPWSPMSCLHLLCLLGLLCAYSQPGIYVVFFGLLWLPGLLGSPVWFVWFSYVCLWFPAWLCLSGHLPALFMSSWSPGFPWSPNLT